MEQQLFLLVEGENEELFCELILKEFFRDRYFDIKVILYSTKKPKEINKKIKQFKTMGHDYILFADMDGSPCVTQRKRKEKRLFSNCDAVNIQVVVQEIEGWYLAGVDDKGLRHLGLSPARSTDTLTKEQFNRLIPATFGRTAFLVELLNVFSVETAVAKNTSFRYFVQKYGLLPQTES